jgi:hypothetical protein
MVNSLASKLGSSPTASQPAFFIISKNEPVPHPTSKIFPSDNFVVESSNLFF